MAIDSALSVFMLSAFFWVVAFLLPQAIREHDRFGVICSVLSALLAFIGWLFIGTGVRSR